VPVLRVASTTHVQPGAGEQQRSVCGVVVFLMVVAFHLLLHDGDVYAAKLAGVLEKNNGGVPVCVWTAPPTYLGRVISHRPSGCCSWA